MRIDKILEKLQIRYVDNVKRAFDILVSSLAIIKKSLRKDGIDEFEGLIDFNFFNLSEKEKEFLWENVDRYPFINRNFVYNLQKKVQKVLTPIERKRLAAYYTKDVGLEIMVEAASLFLDTYSKSNVVIADFFLGSGLTLSRTLEKIGVDRFSAVLGVEPHPLAALVAYASLLYFMRGVAEKIKVVVGDFFKLTYVQKKLNFFHDGSNRVENVDVILTNPPFTRWETLDKRYREFLRKLVWELGYERYVVRGQLNLQLISLFLMDYFLKSDGLLVSVLPASTFYTTSGESVKNLLREKYKILGIVESSFEAAFSTDSGFKELIIACIKKREKLHETAFISLNDAKNAGNISKLFFKKKFDTKMSNFCMVNYVNLHDVLRIWDMNWLVFFGEKKLRNLLSKIFSYGMKTGAIRSWNNVFNRKFLVRGVEIYGPDLFFIPNGFWKLDSDTCEKVIIVNEELSKKLSIGKEYLKATLRRPALYSYRILVEPKHYFIDVPPVELNELPLDVVEYLNWGKTSGAADSALKKFGKYWYSHVFRQIETKKPYGKVFLPDKVDSMFKRRGVFANYSNVPMIASKNFYIIKINSDETCKVLTAWFNSTFFISLLLVAGRKISDHWSRFLRDDYLKLPVPDVKTLSEEKVKNICKSIETIVMKELPPLPYQLDEEYRVKLDISIAEAIGLLNPQKVVEEMHTLLRKYWKIDMQFN